MAVSIYVAPSGYGKTKFALGLVGRAARELTGKPRVCVANQRQMRSWQSRLAQIGGCLGVHLLTFDQLFEECLSRLGTRPTILDSAVQYRLLRAVVGELPLHHYEPIRTLPGFIKETQRTISELKSAHISPEAFQAALEDLGAGARLGELGQIYAAYEKRLDENNWVDRAGLGWRALEALDQGRAALSWDLTVIDGFDDFTQTQLEFLALLADVAKPLVITLTGEIGGKEPRRAHRRFHRTRLRLEEALGIKAQPLPEAAPPRVKTLRHLEKYLFRYPADRIDEQSGLRLVALPDQAAEVRVALRWLKQCIVRENAKPQQVALLARDLAPYRTVIAQVAAEYGMAVDVQDGLPLGQNPLVAALLRLLRIFLPDGTAEDTGQQAPALPRRQVLSVLRSPYFDWEHAQASPESEATIGITPRDVDALDILARRGRVIGGHRQWLEMLDAVAAATQPAGGEDRYEELLTAGGRDLAETVALRGKFRRFLQRMEAPHGYNPYSTYVEWLHGLIGSSGDLSTGHQGQATRPSLGIANSIRASEPPTRDRDVAALDAVDEILRGLLWAQRTNVVDNEVTYSEFVSELAGAIEEASYRPNSGHRPGAIFVGNVVQSRGVPFQAVAILGLSEGLFPGVLADDPFLTFSDRQLLNKAHDLRLDSPLESNEQEYFYEAVTRAWEKVLLTRPRQAETGGEWQPSPFWQEVERLFAVEVERRDQHLPETPSEAASQVEWLEALATSGLETTDAERWQAHRPDWERLRRSARLFGHRYDGRKDDHDGHLPEESALLAQKFGPDFRWSASSLERYQLCPYLFFIGDVLQLEPPPEPDEGLDARQLGSLYHQILEEVYRETPSSRRGDPQALKERLAEIGEAILDHAPQREGFRATAWWRQTRDEILENLRRSIDALSELSSHYVPSYFEVWFGQERSMSIRDGDDTFLLHGIIDRVDVDEQGQVRLIDYKTAGPYRYTARALEEGEKLQLALYAAAAQSALKLGTVDDGFYWHVRHAEPSPFTLADYGTQEAIDSALTHAWHVVHEVRAGHFTPEPPQGGCPDYCPAVGFCWKYTPRARW